MKRFDLRNYKNDFLNRLEEIIDNDLQSGEVGIFIFEIGDFSNIQKVADSIHNKQFMLMNSLRFNEVDWTIVVKKEKVQQSSQAPNQEPNTKQKDEA